MAKNRDDEPTQETKPEPKPDASHRAVAAPDFQALAEAAAAAESTQDIKHILVKVCNELARITAR